ncbi:MAG: hydroxyacylglutathione hydrolase [Gammaproteobacteria bacterium AqS3]|nr:hydroxyacylglutathione hydrolase [Gammaproteobacteria bacterium AqS3]
MQTLTPIPAFSDNYLWLFASDGAAVAVDPGDAAPVQRHLEQHGLRLETILITHWHPDHTGGLAELVKSHRPRVYGPAGENIEHIDFKLVEGDTAEALGIAWSVLDVPGHTAGHIAYFSDAVEGAPILFCGDTLFSGGCGRLFEGTPEQMHASLAKLAVLPADTRVCCAHEYTLSNLAFARAVEPDNTELARYTEACGALREQGRPTLPSSIATELAVNPFMRTDQEAVAAAAGRHLGSPCGTPAEVLGAIRHWKDNF